MSEHKERQRSKSKQEEIEVSELPEKIETPEVKDLLDEIDSVLEENAEQFVKAYVQRGGQ